MTFVLIGIRNAIITYTKSFTAKISWVLKTSKSAGTHAADPIGIFWVGSTCSIFSLVIIIDYLPSGEMR